MRLRDVGCVWGWRVTSRKHGRCVQWATNLDVYQFTSVYAGVTKFIASTQVGMECLEPAANGRYGACSCALLVESEGPFSKMALSAVGQSLSNPDNGLSLKNKVRCILEQRR